MSPHFAVPTKWLRLPLPVSEPRVVVQDTDDRGEGPHSLGEYLHGATGGGGQSTQSTSWPPKSSRRMVHPGGVRNHFCISHPVEERKHIKYEKDMCLNGKIAKPNISNCQSESVYQIPTYTTFHQHRARTVCHPLFAPSSKMGCFTAVYVALTNSDSISRDAWPLAKKSSSEPSVSTCQPASRHGWSTK